jgi:hypothetical protein
LFVQNEEQRESSLWSTTIDSISREEYLEYSSKLQSDISMRELNANVANYVQQVRSGAIALEDIPADLQSTVKQRL